MSDRAGNELLLFVASLPGEADTIEIQSPLRRWFLGAKAISRNASGSDGRGRPSPGKSGIGEEGASEGSSWHFPPEMIVAIDLVGENASRLGRHVTVVDVNRAGSARELVERWVRPSDIFPLLLRPDGARMAGAERFTPRAVRAFVEGR